MRTAVESLLLQALITVKDIGPAHRELGICDNVEATRPFDQMKREYGPTQARERFERVLRPLFREWPEYSGNPVFPVPHPSLTAREAYSRLDDQWDAFTPYGQARLRLLNWLIDTLGAKA